jgi:hypothetical protein
MKLVEQLCNYEPKHDAHAGIVVVTYEHGSTGAVLVACPGTLHNSESVVHSKHFKDGFPLCWSQDREGVFEGSYDDADVTCPDCRKHMGVT